MGQLMLSHFCDVGYDLQLRHCISKNVTKLMITSIITTSITDMPDMNFYFILRKLKNERHKFPLTETCKKCQSNMNMLRYVETTTWSAK